MKNICSAERDQPWNITDLAPGEEEEKIMEDLAEYFTAITSEFEQLQDEQIPSTYDRELRKITPEEIEKMIRTSKKPNGIVPGDFPPKLLNATSQNMSNALAVVFNLVPTTKTWPRQWKREYQTVIPKKKMPTEFGECRNISCTNFYSKVLESFVLQAIQSEVSLSEAQYGGIKGCGTDHFLAEMWNSIVENLEGEQNAINLMSVDFSKAFNRMDHQACVQALALKGASNQSLNMIAAFLKAVSYTHLTLPTNREV